MNDAKLLSKIRKAVKDKQADVARMFKGGLNELSTQDLGYAFWHWWPLFVEMVGEITTSLNPELEFLRLINPKPGDWIVLRVKREPTDAQAAALVSCLKGAFPENKCVILTHGQDLEVREKA